MLQVNNQTSKPAVEAAAELSLAELSAVSGGKLDIQLKSRSVNPIVISRDRALNS